MYSQQQTEQSVTLEPTATASAAVIWLHGLGADGFDFVPIVPELGLPPALPVRFIFPHAPMRPVTINNGYVMRAWYDIRGLSRSEAEDAAGIRESQARIAALIDAQERGGIPSARIVIAGFSQGGAIALQTALRYPQALAGVLALSTYLPLQQTVAQEAAAANRRIPIFMCHGARDPVLPMQLGEVSSQALSAIGYVVDWRTYPMEHSVCPAEIADIGRWLRQVLSPTDAQRA
jgi:phospholipase/carboxylesterase